MNDNLPLNTITENAFPKGKCIKNAFLRGLENLVKNKQHLPNSINYEYGGDLGKNYRGQYYSKNNLDNNEDETYSDSVYNINSKVNIEENKFNSSQKKKLQPIKFPIHSNMTNSFIKSILNTEQNPVKDNNLNDQINLKNTNEMNNDILKLVQENGSIYQKLKKKYGA